MMSVAAWPSVVQRQALRDSARYRREVHGLQHVDLQSPQLIKDKLRVLTAAGQLPDIFFSWAGDFTAKYVQAGLVADLTAPVMNTAWKNILAGGALAAATSGPSGTAPRSCRRTRRRRVTRSAPATRLPGSGRDALGGRARSRPHVRVVRGVGPCTASSEFARGKAVPPPTGRIPARPP
jgi:hypothetical protein